ncbi:conserved protein of unknown function [Magnetospirillum sp. XM-1]|uniref:hypothetical protein n=1 Tax=Magnetospirillum sp. XM-1 TaxID=1663591 RepID=UPI00073DC106|nr:hypothetical protein [Magnetospirillum sp. XM-1]CUW39629.1 conserved protein of unknown function [Magnetospirillum sp. XM-1]
MSESCLGGLEFRCLDAMRTARSKFFDDLVTFARQHHANQPSPGKGGKELPVAILRSDNAYQIAEFYFLIEEFRLNDPERIGAFIDHHNRDMVAMLDAPDILKQQGVARQRIEEAVFSPEQRAKVLENAGAGRLRLDQSDIGRFLAPLISPETCRKTLVALADGGLLDRRNIGQVIVASNGVIEGYFRSHLRQVVNAISTR